LKANGVDSTAVAHNPVPELVDRVEEGRDEVVEELDLEEASELELAGAVPDRVE
jgi:hypothetical protein